MKQIKKNLMGYDSASDLQTLGFKSKASFYYVRLNGKHVCISCKLKKRLIKETGFIEHDFTPAYTIDELLAELPDNTMIKCFCESAGTTNGDLQKLIYKISCDLASKDSIGNAGDHIAETLMQFIEELHKISENNARNN